MTAAGTRNLLVLNGPNLNLLGTREPAIYGSSTLADVEAAAMAAASAHGWTVDCVQSNHEGDLIDAIHAARGTADGIVINPAAYSHTSVAIPDALSGVELPVVEVHLSNIHRREEFRHHSFVSAVAEVVICGAGISGYRMAVDYLIGSAGQAAE
ncbi:MULTISPECIES: type II 3-dehydroquinate dehydratase [Arthrobacter]|uniref:3-dehydroquinate dehydratase n=1 Tax=Arthrobacter jinronghuae TaxID=2964609 RepID=A0ABT1NPP0_9MICC|nr:MULTISPECIES: type II 3-dehydroquinate dehydratase [Arthrobacter]MCQ1949047.1 type II 3-dehydroquinate dehydratase [Arthrobacter jinronghuae]MCQ1952373.1 type II 3-dehydroquinate dehydratase [Arthrobacter sp. zg-Y238]MCQ1955510.1 type II 3-dehydroquinate dehydratase [Arthrobacter jinronghuae]UWX78157.1 type II 3-dehydroquinate dehydratase [Arthrobacter jinronghuae]